MNAFSKLGLEEIRFQNGSFFKELALIFAECREMSEEDFLDGVGTTKLIKAIKDTLGLTVVFEVADDGPAILPPDINRNNPLMNEFRQNYFTSTDGLRVVNGADGIIKGTVNLRTSKVSGIFSELPATLYFPYVWFRKNMYTPEECAAVLLHELGHFFTYCEFIARTVRTNQVLAGISRVMDNTNSPDEREIVLISAKKMLNIPDLDVKELSRTNNKLVVETVIMARCKEKSRDELGYDIYNLNNWEYLSDQFSARHGAGRELATALEKLYRSHNHISFRSTAAFYGMEAVKLVVAMLYISASIATAGTPAAPLVQMRGLLPLVVLLVVDGVGDETYDRPGMRLKRIRDQVLENLKQAKLGDGDRKRLQSDVKFLNDMLKGVEDRMQLTSKIWSYFSPSLRKRLKAEDLARDLEDLASNQLFAISDELSMLK